MSKENSRKGHKYEISIGTAIMTIVIVQALWPGVIPFEMFSVWQTKGGILDWLAAGWPFLAWGFGIQTLIILVHWEHRLMRDTYEAASPIKILKVGALISLQAGVVEEISFRWLIFFAQIFWLKVANFLIFGFLGFGLTEFFQVNMFGPIADLTTLGSLQVWLTNPTTWAVGAAMLGTNAFFRDGHAYQGWFGILNSWCLGMAFFWLMFSFGLPSAILIHVLYDLVIFATIALFAAIRKR
jgi:hypothetical protein